MRFQKYQSLSCGIFAEYVFNLKTKLIIKKIITHKMTILFKNLKFLLLMYIIKIKFTIYRNFIYVIEKYIIILIFMHNLVCKRGDRREKNTSLSINIYFYPLFILWEG
jgi:hypothetical protein